MKVEKSDGSSNKKLALFAFAVAFMFLFVGSVSAINNVTLNEPDDDADVTGQNVTLDATLGGNDGNITNVSFYYWNSTSDTWAFIGNATNQTNNDTDYNIAWNTTTVSDGTYSLNATALDNSSGSWVINSSDNNTGITVDNTAPNVSAINNPSDGSAHSSSELVLNASVNDSLVGVDTVYFDVSNSSGSERNVTATNSGGVIWNGTLNLSNLAEGSYNVTVYANDTLGNLNDTERVEITVDRTDPSATASCEDINSGQELDCSCSGGISTSTSTDADDGVNDDQYDSGTHTFTCKVTDDAGNTATDTAEYTVSSSGGGGSSGSGSGVSKSPAVSRIWNEVNPGEASVMTNFNEDTGLREISINVNNPVKDVKIEVSKYDGKPAEVSVEKSGNVFRYLEINADRKLNDDISEATISAKVEKSWIEDNSLNMDQVSVYKFDESAEEWTELDTSFTDEDDSNYYYDANVDGFSFFSIGESSASGSDSSGESGDTTTPEDTSGTSEDGQTGDTTDQSDGSSAWIWIVIALVVVGVVAYFVLNRNSSK